MFVIRRHIENPLLTPSTEHAWDGDGAFNWCPAERDGVVHAVYRALAKRDPLAGGPDHFSTIGAVTSHDGVHFNNRRQLIAPTETWEQFGCEDPRVCAFEGSHYIFYTALSEYPFTPKGIKVACAKTDDFKTVHSKRLITPFTSKAMALFPERINGKMTAILTADSEQVPKKIAIAQFENEEEMYSPEFWARWYGSINEHRIYPERHGLDQIEVGAPPIKTKYGWLLVYSLIENHEGRMKDYQYVYGIEALLLDLNDPRRIIGATKGPMFTPEMRYEREGYVKDVIFPSGARVVGDMLQIYYGGADTTGCIAEVRLDDLAESLYPPKAVEMKFSRVIDRPVLLPDPTHPWEAKAVFNPAAAEIDGVTHIFYRAMGHDDTSFVGLALSHDGKTISERLAEPVYVPRADFEQKRHPGNSGCEDPRVSVIGDRLYMLYTAYDAEHPPRVAITSISLDDVRARQWRWEEPQLVSPEGIDDKDACILPRPIDGKYVLFHRINGNICIDAFPSLDFSKQKAARCIELLSRRPGMWDNEKVGIAGVPFETDEGWVMLYHGVSHAPVGYRVGAALLKKDDPTTVLARTADYLFEPELLFEREGIIRNVVFPCGHVVKDGIVYIYYGGADTVVGIATMPLEKILRALKGS